MRCICCLSDKTVPDPSGLGGYYGCLGCGLLFKGRDEERPDQGASSHYERVEPHEAVAGSKKLFFKQALAYLSSRRVNGERSLLDVGCGYGYFLDLASRYGWQTFGVEILGGPAREAEKRIGEGSVFHGTLKEATYPDNSFDVITLWDVLFLVEDPFEELSECYRIAHEGGIIGLRVRNVFFQKMAYRFYSLLRKVGCGSAVKKPFVFHQHCFSREALCVLLRRIGFVHVVVTNSPLTEGDPYGYSNIQFFTRAAKAMIALVCRLVFWMSSGNVIIGPSFLVWAEKPWSKMTRKGANFRG